MSISSIIGVLFLIIYIKSPYKKEHLIVNSWLSMICVIFIGSLIGKIIPPSSLMGVGISVSVVDIISFTKIGTKTTNAKIMASKELMWKLIVYGKSFKNRASIIGMQHQGTFLPGYILSHYRAPNELTGVFR